MGLSGALETFFGAGSMDFTSPETTVGGDSETT